VPRHTGGRLQQQRGLADAGLAAKQYERAGDDAAAEHAIEFVDTGGQARVLFDFDVGVELRRAAAPASAYGCPATGAPPLSCGRSSTNEFHAPQSAQRPQPLRRLAAALLTDKHGLGRFTHRYSLSILLPMRHRIS
jgi:hypothetical protein